MSPVFKVSNYLDAYRLKAKYSQDFHELDGRRAHRALTEFTNQIIWNELAPLPDDSLVDVGCGDGCLLRMAEDKGVQRLIGLSGSEEEAIRLRQEGLNVLQGLTDSLPLPDEPATIVVCNAVLLLVPFENILPSLKEISRIARRGAGIFIGEIPAIVELADEPRSHSVPRMLWFLLRRRGMRTFFGMCRRLMHAVIHGEVFILNSAPVTEFYASPEDFIRMAATAGLEIKRYFRHEDLDPRGKVRKSECRYNYVFVKV